jgi:hypothetical protein
MLHDLERSSLRRCLDLVEELQDPGLAFPRPAASTLRRQDARRREVLRQLRRLCMPGGRDLRPRWLTRLISGHEFEDREFVLLLGLLHRRISGAAPVATGRELLALLGAGPAEILLNAPLLHPGARLLRSGLVESRIARPEQSLDGGFRLSERAFLKVYRSLHRIRAPRRGAARAGFADATEHLCAWRDLVQLHERRAAVLFPRSLFAEEHGDALESAAELSEAIHELRRRILERERATGSALRLPLRDLRRTHELGHAEEIIVLALLFREFLHGLPMLSVAELLRLVAEKETDVLLHRRLLGPSGRLVSGGLVGIDAEIDEKPLLAGAYLRSWVTEQLLDSPDLRVALTSRDRARFHAYLEGLEDSEDFFRNL